MGVRRSDYIVIGLNIGKQHYDDSKFEDFEEYMDVTKVGEMTYLVDSYSSKYFVVGEIIKCDKDGSDGLGFNEFSTTADTLFIEAKERVRKFIKGKFGFDGEPQLIVLTQWS